jgi:hypothetical protein
LFELLESPQTSKSTPPFVAGAVHLTSNVTSPELTTLGIEWVTSRSFSRRVPWPEMIENVPLLASR